MTPHALLLALASKSTPSHVWGRVTVEGLPGGKPGYAGKVWICDDGSVAVVAFTVAEGDAFQLFWFPERLSPRVEVLAGEDAARADAVALAAQRREQWGALATGGRRLVGLMRPVVVSGAEWLEILILSPDGSFKPEKFPERKLDGIEPMSEAQARLDVLPKGSPCVKHEEPSARPGACRTCGCTIEEHAAEAARAAIQQALRALGWTSEPIDCRWAPTPEAAEPRVIGVATRPKHPRDRRVLEDEQIWRKLEHRGLPVVPWEEAQRETAESSGAPEPEDAET